jgi:hypothetical protein
MFGIKRKDIKGCEDGSVYLTRWTLLSTRLLTIYLHHFHRSDWSESLHDHPWPFASLILWGGYSEVTRESHLRLTDEGEHVLLPVRRWKWPGSLLLRPANWLHRVEIESGKTAWSLVFAGPRVREWGFLTPTGWRDQREYLGALGCLGDD